MTEEKTPTKDDLNRWFWRRPDGLYWKMRPSQRSRAGTRAGAVNRTQSRIITVPGFGRFTEKYLLEVMDERDIQPEDA